MQGATGRWNGVAVAKSSVCLLEPGDAPDHDILICLDCGCLFYRTGVLVHPHGVDDERLVGE
jgi:hypothetical protein